MNNCEHCSELQVKYEINSLNELKNAIKVVSANLLDKTIAESDYWPEGEEKIQMVPFSKVNESGTFDDFIIYYFECPECNQKFRLSCEAFHGAGGEWSLI